MHKEESTMRYYTSNIPRPLAEKLKEKGMPMEEGSKSMTDWKVPTYAEVFDWLLEKSLEIYIVNYSKIGNKEGLFRANIVQENTDYTAWSEFGITWHEAANAAIEKASTLI